MLSLNVFTFSSHVIYLKILYAHYVGYICHMLFVYPMFTMLNQFFLGMQADPNETNDTIFAALKHHNHSNPMRYS